MKTLARRLGWKSEPLGWLATIVAAAYTAYQQVGGDSVDWRVYVGAFIAALLARQSVVSPKTDASRTEAALVRERMTEEWLPGVGE